MLTNNCLLLYKCKQIGNMLQLIWVSFCQRATHLTHTVCGHSTPLVSSSLCSGYFWTSVLNLQGSVKNFIITSLYVDSIKVRTFANFSKVIFVLLQTDCMQLPIYWQSESILLLFNLLLVQSRSEDIDWLQMVTELIPAFKAAISKATRSQVHCSRSE